MIYTTTLPVDVLYAHRNDPSWALVDCRFDLKQPEWGIANYRQGHIPGAVYAHLDRDLAGPIVPGKTGRHPLPDLQIFKDKLSQWGIDGETQVIVYDTSGGAYAARLWWMLRFLGHYAVAVLDGGYQAWQAAGYPVMQGDETRIHKNFTGEPHWDMVASSEEVERIRQDPDYRLIDARAAERYRGEVEPIDPVAGHIPGAVNRFHGANLAPDGKFLSDNSLRSDFKMLLGDVKPEHAVVYCGSGVTSCHHLVAMEKVGLKGAKLYIGSWSHWITDRKRPIS